MITALKTMLLLFSCLWVIPSEAQEASHTKPPFSPFTAHNELVFVSGQIGLTKEGKLTRSDFLAEAAQTLENVQSVLGDAGLTFKDVLNVTVYLKDIEQFEEFNRVYRRYFQAPFPARTCVAVKELVMGASVEISVVASSAIK